jgi:single-strand DNA-binding protein
MSSDLNNNIMQGRLTRDAELKYTNTGVAILKFSIASNKSFKKDDKWETKVTFMECVVWGKYGESLAKHLTKGKKITVKGETEQNTWERDGVKHSKHQINVDAVYDAYTGTKTGNTSEPDQPEGKEIPSNTNNDFNDDIPF